MEHETDKTRKKKCIDAACAYDIVTGLMTLREREFAHYRLSPMERRVAGLLLDGETNAVIAQALYLSIPGVKYHIRNIYRKAGCVSKTEFCRAVRASIRRAAFEERPSSTSPVPGV